MDEEWDQRLASSRSIETMRRIAQDASRLSDDAAAFQAYAARHKITANEVVYYLNAYEYGGEAGLQAIRNPDIIPPDVARRAVKTIVALLDERFPGQPPCRITDEGTAIGVYEVQQRMNGDLYLIPHLPTASDPGHLAVAPLLDARVRCLVALSASQARPQIRAQGPGPASLGRRARLLLGITASSIMQLPGVQRLWNSCSGPMTTWCDSAVIPMHRCGVGRWNA